MKTKTIRVTKRDISNGSTGDPLSCPVAQALDRNGINPYVTGVFLDMKDRIPCPKIVERFIERFDDGRKVKPFTFNIKVP